MAKYRPVYTKIWKDPDFQDLEPNSKLIFIYLCTNESTTESGIYPVTLKTISNETGVPPLTVSKLLGNGCIKNIGYDFGNRIVFVKNFRTYGSGGKPDLIKKSIVNDCKATNNSNLWDFFIKVYPEYREDILTVYQPLDNGCSEIPFNLNLNLNLNLNPNLTCGLETESELSQSERKQQTAEMTEIFNKDFWTVYPKRNGKRLDKQEALKVFLTIPKKEIKNVIAGVNNYAGSKEAMEEIGTKNAFRWLNGKGWEEWQAPEEIDTHDDNGHSQEYLTDNRKITYIANLKARGATKEKIADVQRKIANIKTVDSFVNWCKANG